MFFDQYGMVRACCMNPDHPMGNITQHSIREIWDGAYSRALRDALQIDDYSLGCGYCQWQVEQGNSDLVFARNYDLLPAQDKHPRWPVQMEFSMTNSCNLQCVMCNGDWSSSIRAHREHRDPLPVVYGDRFFDELAEFLPHLHRVNVLGGEPFLGSEPLRLFTMLTELDGPPKVTVTTNGTQWTPRVQSICERLPMSFVLSLDGITKATYESIRIGADFDRVMSNLNRFEAHAERHGTTVGLAHCLMPPNVHEFSRLLRFAEDRGFKVFINEVLFPVELSLFQLPVATLRDLVAEMDRDPIAATLTRLRPTWDAQLGALRNRLRTLEQGTQVFVQPWTSDENRVEAAADGLASKVLTEYVGDEPPTLVVIDPQRPMAIEGLRTNMLAPVLSGADTPDQVLEALAGITGPETRRSRPRSPLMNDVVLSDPSAVDPIEIRASWTTSNGITVMLIAIRNWPIPPSDPVGIVAATSPDGRVVMLHCEDGQVRGVEGDPAPLGLASEDLTTGATVDVGAVMSQRHGPMEVTHGPSGYDFDLLVRFGNDDDRAFTLRVLTERTDAHHERIVVAPFAPTGDGSPQTPTGRVDAAPSEAPRSPDPRRHALRVGEPRLVVPPAPDVAVPDRDRDHDHAGRRPGRRVHVVLSGDDDRPRPRTHHPSRSRGI